MKDKVEKTEEEWKTKLSSKAYYVLREKVTEPPFTGKYCSNKGNGIYYCAACGNPLFGSENKYYSITDWPSFYAPISKNSVYTQKDKSYGEAITEVNCSRCQSHLGRVFSHGPDHTGLKYCINSFSLKFEKD